MKINIKVDSPEFIPKYSKIGDAGMDLVAASEPQYNAEKDYIEYDTGISLEIPEGYVGLVFPRSSISKYNLQLCNSVGVIDSGYRGRIKARFKLIKPDSNINKLGVSVYHDDLAKYYKEDYSLTPDDFKDSLLEEVREDTPHGEHGVTEWTQYHKFYSKYYKVTIENIQWNRYNKEYYFIDMYDSPNITMQEITEDDLPSFKIPKIYKKGDRIAQLIILPYPQVEFNPVDKLESTERGTGGFGSSGN